MKSKKHPVRKLQKKHKNETKPNNAEGSNKRPTISGETEPPLQTKQEEPQPQSNLQTTQPQPHPSKSRRSQNSSTHSTLRNSRKSKEKQQKHEPQPPDDDTKSILPRGHGDDIGDSDATYNTNTNTEVDDTVAKSMNVGDLAKSVGRPVDINKLIYAPKPVKTETTNEKATGQYIDWVFVMANFCTLIVAMFHLLLGLTILSFSSSMQSILEESGDDIHAILHTINETSPSKVSLLLIAVGIIQIINVLCGVYAGVQGFKNVLILHEVISIVCLVGTAIFAALLYRGAECNSADIKQVQDKLFEYMTIYGTKSPKDSKERASHETAAFQLDSMQVGLSCCGANNWADYMNPDILQNGNPTAPLPIHTDLDKVETVFPSSCCRAWWIRNVHCAKGAHLWAHPAVDKKTALKFRQRINQAGCMWRIKLGCERILLMANIGLLVCVVVDLILVLTKSYCVYTIEKVIWQIIRMKKEFIENESGTSDKMEDDEHDEVLLMQKAVGAPLPTEDETELIKARTDFNKFEARVKRTQIGKWMKQARKSVYLSFKRKSMKADLLGHGETSGGLLKSPDYNVDDVDEQFLDTEQVLKLELQKLIMKQKERQEKELQNAGEIQVPMHHNKLKKRKKH